MSRPNKTESAILVSLMCSLLPEDPLSELFSFVLICKLNHHCLINKSVENIQPYKARFIANYSSCTTNELSNTIKNHVIKYRENVYERYGIFFFLVNQIHARYRLSLNREVFVRPVCLHLIILHFQHCSTILLRINWWT